MFKFIRFIRRCWNFRQIEERKRYDKELHQRIRRVSEAVPKVAAKYGLLVGKGYDIYIRNIFLANPPSLDFAIILITKAEFLRVVLDPRFQPYEILEERLEERIEDQTPNPYGIVFFRSEDSMVSIGVKDMIYNRYQSAVMDVLIRYYDLRVRRIIKADGGEYRVHRIKKVRRLE